MDEIPYIHEDRPENCGEDGERYFECPVSVKVEIWGNYIQNLRCLLCSDSEID